MWEGVRCVERVEECGGRGWSCVMGGVEVCGWGGVDVGGGSMSVLL